MSMPSELDPEAEIAVLWTTHEDGTTTVTAELQGAKISVHTDPASSHLVPWLVASTPQILEAAWTAASQQQNPDTNQQEAP